MIALVTGSTLALMASPYPPVAARVPAGIQQKARVRAAQRNKRYGEYIAWLIMQDWDGALGQPEEIDPETTEENTA